MSTLQTHQDYRPTALPISQYKTSLAKIYSCSRHINFSTHVAKSEHRLLSFVKAVDLHLTIITTQN